MQVIWKGTTELGIGKAEGRKNGRRYTYIVARYRPAITYDALKNVFKGKFNPLYCRSKPTSSLPETIQNRASSRVQAISIGNVSKQPRILLHRPANFRPLLASARQPIVGLNLKKIKNPASGYKLNYAKYGKDNLKITNGSPNGQGYQMYDNKLSYYAGNAWGATPESKLPMASSDYYPKKAEVLEEFVEGDDPDEKRKYEQIASNNNNDDDENGVNEGFTPTLVPIMNSEDAEIDDESEDELATKNHVPKHSH